MALEWFWPDAYLGKVQFQIVATSDLNLAATAQPIAPLHQGGGVLRALLPNSGGTLFFKLVLQLRF